MKFKQFTLTDIAVMFIFRTAACPLFARKSCQSLSHIGDCLDLMGADLQTETNILSAHKYQPEWFRRTNVPYQQICYPRTTTNPDNSCRTQKVKIFSSGLLGLVYSSLIQSGILYASALWEWFMQNQTTDLQATSVRWVTLEKCAELVGWTKDAINALRVKGKIRMDVHWIKRNGRIFIDMAAFQQWLGTGR